MLDGLSREELQDLAERKNSVNLPFIPSDLNNKISFIAAQEQMKRLHGFDEEQLKQIGERRAPAVNILPSHVNGLPLAPKNGLIEAALDMLNTMTKIRLK